MPDKLSAGMPIRYLGIDIGQVQSLELNASRNEVQASAVLYPGICQHFRAPRYSLLGYYAANLRPRA
ncbi:mce related protein [Kluyvera cryocrescens]|uniref:Mce related protein n=1 Tax=Kluyvera cryocrescens TaxID=580 RepID=A0A485A4S2_KLUCR|nr:mce related protein [Kluyvera cryocrescens]